MARAGKTWKAQEFTRIKPTDDARLLFLPSGAWESQLDQRAGG